MIQSTYVGKLDSDDNDHIRRCVVCGKPIKEGYYLGGKYACSDDCALALYNGDEKQMYIDLHYPDEARVLLDCMGIILSLTTTV